MATVTLQYDGRSAAMKKLIELFVTLGGIVTEQKETNRKKGLLTRLLQNIVRERPTRQRTLTTSLNSA